MRHESLARVNATVRYKYRLRAIGSIPVVLVIAMLVVAGMQTQRMEPSVAEPSKNISLTELWRMGDSEDDEVLFSRLPSNSIAVDAKNQIYIADWTPHIYMLDGAGNLVTTIGRRGAGPGEFEWATSLFVDAADAVCVFDLQQKRVVVFSPEGRSVMFTRTLQDSELSYPSEIVGIHSTGFFVTYVSSYSGSGGGERILEDPRTVDVHYVDRSGDRSPKPFITLPYKRKVVMTDRWGGFSVYDAPFPPAPRVQMSLAGLLYSGFGETIEITVRSPDGDMNQVIRQIHQPVPVSSRELDEFFGNASKKFREKAGSPEFKPAFQYFEVDDKANVWIKLSAPDGAELATWIVMDPSFNELARVEVPIAVRLEAIRGNRAYGVHEVDESVEAPFLIAYEIQ